MATRLLFVCSNNRDRSKTAEDMYISDPRFEVHSAGTDVGAEVPVTRELVSWADIIVAMNEKRDRHIFKLKQKFPFLKPMGKKIIDLDIENSYVRGDPKLREEIRAKMERYFPTTQAV